MASSLSQELETSVLYNVKDTAGYGTNNIIIETTILLYSVKPPDSLQIQDKSTHSLG